MKKNLTILLASIIFCSLNFNIAEIVFADESVVVAGQQSDIDWQAFLSKQDPIWEKLPQKFDHGAFLGNGLLGTTIFQDGTQQI
ncbi:MAG: hypothetical protein LBI18_15740, partial [Planctomycetaceae bacterium]|nr:hypothetical protein [Planctomycetaceae bacterium]